MNEQVPYLRVFISSPSDVSTERKIAMDIIENLPNQHAFRDRVAFRIVAWDKPSANVAMLANFSPQESLNSGMPKPSECDIVIVIFWTRMGTPFVDENGKAYESGTHWELLDALNSHTPITMIFRREIGEGSGNEEQSKKVEAFFNSELFYDAEGRILRGVNKYKTPKDFRIDFKNYFEEQVQKLLESRKKEENRQLSLRVFISFNQEDAALAKSIYGRLIDWGHMPWMSDLDAPQDFQSADVSEVNLKDCDVVIGVMSPSAMTSRNIRNQWDWSIVHRKKLMLVILETCIVHPNYASLTWVADFRRDQENAFVRLRAALDSINSTDQPADPYYDYLVSLYDRISDYLAHVIVQFRKDIIAEPLPMLVSYDAENSLTANDKLDPFLLSTGRSAAPAKVISDFDTAVQHFLGRAILLGKPGAGKSVLLAYYAQDKVVRRLVKQSEALPFWVPIGTWDAHKLAGLAIQQLQGTIKCGGANCKTQNSSGAGRIRRLGSLTAC